MLRSHPTKRLKEPRVINRQLFKRRVDKPVATKWWSDPIRWIPIIISAIALTISYLSWQESHRGRRINEEVNRPILTLSSMEVTSGYMIRVGPDPDRGFAYHVAVKMKNIGKATAVIRRYRVIPIFENTYFRKDLESPPKCREYYRGEAGMAFQEPEKVMTIFTGTEQLFSGSTELSLGCEENPTIQFMVRITVEYANAGTDQIFSQEFLERIKANTAELKKKREHPEY